MFTLRTEKTILPISKMDLFKLECAKHYDSVDYSLFDQEFNRLQIIKKHTKKYYKCGVLNERLFLNHIIILYNMFGIFATNMIFRSLPYEHWGMLVTVLDYLDRMPYTIPYTQVKTLDIQQDQIIKKRLAAI
jgi:hypothetical protein